MMLICLEKMDSEEKENFIDECLDLRLELLTVKSEFKNISRITNFINKKGNLILYSNEEILNYILDFSVENELIEKTKLNVWHESLLRYENVDFLEKEYKKPFNAKEKKYIEYLQSPAFMCLMRAKDIRDLTTDQERVLRNSKIRTMKDKEKFLEFINYIIYLEEKIFKNLEFTPNTLFKFINNELKEDQDFVLRYMEKACFANIQIMPEKLQFNQEIALKAISLNINNLANLEPIFFENEDFLLKLCKILDEKKTPSMLKYLPAQLISIFDTQEINNNYEKNLRSCLNYISLQEKLANANSEMSGIKKKKI